MEARENNGDTKMFAAVACMVIGFLFAWNITTQIAPIHELRLDAETCYRVKSLGLSPSSAECVFTAPFRQVGVGQAVGFLMLPDGSEMQVSPLAAEQKGGSAEWSASMKTQLVMALLFWVATFVLLFSAFRDREDSSS